MFKLKKKKQNKILTNEKQVISSLKNTIKVAKKKLIEMLDSKSVRKVSEKLSPNKSCTKRDAMLLISFHVYITP